MPITQPYLSYQDISEISDYVNDYRARNQAPPLIWNSVIASFSQNWSYNMTNTHSFKHSGTPSYGENIAYFRGYGTNVIELIKLAFDNWYNEISLYNFNRPGYSEATGHFTCLVWVASKSFGMGISIDTDTGEAYISMNTSPPGNIIGQFQENVLPLGSRPIPIPIPTPIPTPIPRPIPTPTPTPIPSPPTPTPPTPPYPIPPTPTPPTPPYPVPHNPKQRIIRELMDVISDVNRLHIGYKTWGIVHDLQMIVNDIQRTL
jgi:hypothetical protein